MFKHDMPDIVEDTSTSVSRPSFDQLSPRIHLSLLLLLTALIYVGSAWSPALQDDADSAHAEAAREIVQRGDWVTLHINGVRYLEKAPLIYWAVALSYKIFGFTEFATRLPLAIGAILLVAAVYYFGRWMGGGRAGFYSGLAMCTGLGVYLFTRVMIPEVIITLFLTVAFYFFLKVYLGELDARWSYVFYACMAAAVLTKGLIGVVFPCGALFVFVLMTKGWRQLLKMRPIRGSLLFLVIAVPWHALAIWRNEKFFWFYFINEHVLRYLGKREPADYDTVPIASFWLLHLVWLFPFSVFLPLGLGRLRALWRPTEREDQLRLFACVWALVVICFFSFSTRQEYYTFPAFPALALLAGVGLARGEMEKSRWVTAGQGLLAFVGAVVGAALGCLLWLSRNAGPATDISQTLTQNPENYKLALGHMSDLTVEAFAVLRVPAAGAALSLSIGFVVAFILRRKHRATQAGLLTAVTVACFIYFAHLALGIFNPYLSSQPLAAAIKRRLATGDLVVINGEYQAGSSLGFYLPQKILLLNGRMTGLEFGSHYPDAPPVFIGDGDIAQLWQGERRVFLFTRDGDFEKVRSVIKGEIFRLASAGEKSIYSNRP
ncbi:MAG TPA: glycosyltransferase family 39 protein [Blastocatellia bacterium]|nr:glycosyltransferase family 39 protein [Blastocatellia bacterium]